MAERFDAISDKIAEFIGRQHMFFTASAAAGTRVNISPRSTDYFRVIGPNLVAYLDRTGSGNETAAHMKADGRLTIMFCATDGPPLILRLYGTGRILHRDSAQYEQMLADTFGGDTPLGARQIVCLDVDLVQTSCGYGVPFHEFKGERPSMDNWAIKKGPEGIPAYWREKNTASMDGLPTGIFDPE